MLIFRDPVRVMTSLTPKEVAGNGDPCAGAYAGGGTLGCGHGDRPEVGHGDGNQVNLILYTPDCRLEKVVINTFRRGRSGNRHWGRLLRLTGLPPQALK